MSAKAVPTGETRDMMSHEHPITRDKTLDTGPDVRDLSGHLVPQNHRRSHTLVEYLVDVRAAETAGTQANEHFSGTNLRDFDVLVADRPNTVIHSCFHGYRTTSNPVFRLGKRPVGMAVAPFIWILAGSYRPGITGNSESSAPLSIYKDWTPMNTPFGSAAIASSHQHTYTRPTVSMGNDDRNGIISKIARLYYLEDMNQKKIGEKLNISLATVSRNLTRAKERGIVEIVLHDTREGESSLEVEIEKRFGLKECIVTQSAERRENTYRAMGPPIGDLLARVLRPGEGFGVSWGETLREVSESLVIDRPTNANVIPIIGAMGEVETGIYPNAIAASFAQKLGGKNYLINAPAVLDSEQIKQSIENDRNFSGVRKRWRNLSTAIVSVSNVGSDASITRHGIFSDDELQHLQDLEVECATNFNFIDSAGLPVTTDFDRRMIKMGLSELARIPNLIVVAAGPEKVRPILAALAGGFVDILVVDHDTAEAILAEPAIHQPRITAPTRR